MPFALPLLASALLAGLAGAQLEIPGKRAVRPNTEELQRATGGRANKGTRPGLELPTGGPVRPLVTTIPAETGGKAPAESSAVPPGEPAELEGARADLAGTRPEQLVPAFRTLLDQGSAQDRELVRERLRKRVPSRVAGALLGALVASDPTLASPSFLLELLDHPTGALRQAAYHTITKRAAADWIPLFVGRYQSGRPGARTMVLDLVARLSDPAALRLLVSALGDSRASVAGRAAEHLAEWRETEALPVLRLTAFGEDADELSLRREGGSRTAGYALLSIVLRELREGRSLLEAADVPALLLGLRKGHTLMAGASAAALAGIGFRAALASDSTWLNDEVPDTLVRLATGYEFHADYSSLRGPGLRRLALISGNSLGTDGYRWQAWWAEHAEGFRARRAVLALGKDDHMRLRVFYRPLRGSGIEPFELCGPAVASAHVQTPAGVALFLTSYQAFELLGELQAEGVFGAERMPGRLGTGQRELRRIAVRIGSSEKIFEVERGRELPWFERVEELLLERARSLTWQTWFDPEAYASAYECYVTERWYWSLEPRGFRLGRSEHWWEREDSLASIRERLKTRILRRLAESQPEDRERGLDELERLEEESEVFTQEDFAALLGLLEDEDDYGTRFSPNPNSRARRIVQLLIAAGSAEASPAARAVSMRPVLARALFEFLLEHYGEAARVDLERVLVHTDVEVQHAEARSSVALRRALSAHALGVRLNSAGHTDQVERELFLGLFGDREPEVVLAAITVAGEFKLESARPYLLRKARLAEPTIRAAALRALGKLGGDEVAQLLVLALAEDDPELERAAAEGLADLADPGSAPLLASLFAQGAASAVFPAARRGLVNLGSEAWPDLLRLTAAGDSATRRDAALLLAEASVPQAVSVLLTTLTLDGGDQRVAEELAVLTCVDLRAEEDPARAWWDWWDLVVHDDANAWLLAAGARAGVELPAADALGGRGTSGGVRFLLELAELEEPHLRVRARRELSRLLGRSLAPVPSKARERARWRSDVEASARELFDS